MELIKFFIGLILIIILSLLALPIFSKTVYEYNKYGTKTGYYVQNGNVTTYYNKYGSKQYQYKNNVKYDRYGRKIKEIK
jgi:hypothetical protein